MTDRTAIVIGYDGSDEARLAIERAGALLPGRQAVVVCAWQSLAAGLLHTNVDELTGTMREAADELDAADAEAATERAAEGSELAASAGLEASALAVRSDGAVWTGLLASARELDAAAIVVGSRGLSRLRSVLLGSVSHAVLHRAGGPVLVVPPGAGGADGPVVLCDDGSRDAREAIGRAGDLLGGRTALVVTAWQSVEDAMSAGLLGAPRAVLVSASQQFDAEARDRAAETAQEGAEAARAAGFEAVESEAVRTRGPIWEALVETAARRLAATVVVGSRGRSRIASAALGSVSRAVAAHAETPVLVAPAGD